MIRAVTLIAVLASAVAFAPFSNRMVARQQLSMATESFQSKVSKAVAVAALSAGLFAPIAPALAEGASSASTLFRARNYYGARVLDLEKAASSGDFAAFTDKKAQNGFTLLISATNRVGSKVAKATAASESKLFGEINAAISAKDAAKLKSAYSEFVKVADLKSAFGPNDAGQTDSSGYSPTWGTSKQFIYIR